jgi:hypothetical protein
VYSPEPQQNAVFPRGFTGHGQAELKGRGAGLVHVILVT